MVILGVDPGFCVTGFSVIKKEKGKIYLLDLGALTMSSNKELSDRVGIFYDFLYDKIVKWNVTAISLETPFLGKNAQNFLKLGYLRGILYLLACKHNLKLLEFSPRQVKLSITGFGGAEKDQVARAVLCFFPGLSMPAKLDVTDALAVGLCGAWSNTYL